MAPVTFHTVEALKAAGHYFAAGALAASLGQSDNYGCHLGMRSTLDHARDEFKRGYRLATPSASR